MTILIFLIYLMFRNLDIGNYISANIVLYYQNLFSAENCCFHFHFVRKTGEAPMMVQ